MEVLSSATSLKLARRTQDEFATEGKYEPVGFNNLSVVYRRHRKDGKEDVLAIEKRGDRKFCVVKEIRG